MVVWLLGALVLLEALALGFTYRAAKLHYLNAEMLEAQIHYMGVQLAMLGKENKEMSRVLGKVAFSPNLFGSDGGRSVDIRA